MLVAGQSLRPGSAFLTLYLVCSIQVLLQGGESREDVVCHHHAAKDELDKDSAYIRAAEHQVYFSPSLSLLGFSDLQRAKLLTVAKTASEWEAVFKNIQGGSLPEWLRDEDLPALERVEIEEEVAEEFDLLSPTASADKKGI